MESHLYHLQLNIDYSNKDFYQNLMQFLGWAVIFEGEGMMGYRSKQSGDLWFIGVEDKEVQDYDARGLNHLAIRVGKEIDVDNLHKFMIEHGIEALFSTPRHREEFANSADETYYQVMFKSPDDILFEVVYIGVKN